MSKDSRKQTTTDSGLWPLRNLRFHRDRTNYYFHTLLLNRSTRTATLFTNPLRKSLLGDNFDYLDNFFSMICVQDLLDGPLLHSSTSPHRRLLDNSLGASWCHYRTSGMALTRPHPRLESLFALHLIEEIVDVCSCHVCHTVQS